MLLWMTKILSIWNIFFLLIFNMVIVIKWQDFVKSWSFLFIFPKKGDYNIREDIYNWKRKEFQTTEAIKRSSRFQPSLTVAAGPPEASVYIILGHRPWREWDLCRCLGLTANSLGAADSLDIQQIFQRLFTNINVVCCALRTSCARRGRPSVSPW